MRLIISKLDPKEFGAKYSKKAGIATIGFYYFGVSVSFGNKYKRYLIRYELDKINQRQAKLRKKNRKKK